MTTFKILATFKLYHLLGPEREDFIVADGYLIIRRKPQSLLEHSWGAKMANKVRIGLTKFPSIGTASKWERSALG